MLKKHKPSSSYNQQLSKFANDLIDQLWFNNYHDQQKSPIFPISDIVLGGSIAKGTWLKDSADIDIFVKLDADSSRTDLEHSLEIGKNTLDSLKGYSWSLRYSEHPYIEAETKFLGKIIKINIYYGLNFKFW